MKAKGRILKIAQMGHPILHQNCRQVKDPSDPNIQNLIQDMETTVDFMNCSGLAAPQVFTPVRIVLFRVVTKTNNLAYQLTPEYDPEGVPWTLMINPKVKPLSNEMSVGWEQCLSLPNLMGKVPRYHSIEYTFLNREGKEEKRIAHGFHARVVQHECDHLDGILYPQRIKDMTYFGFREDIIREYF